MTAVLGLACAQLVLSVVLIMKLAGNLVTTVAMKTFRCILCGYCLKQKIANPDRSYVPPYTEVYERELDPRFEHELLDQEVTQGWILNTDTEGRQWVAKQWLTEGVTDGIPHYQGQKKRTWEVPVPVELHVASPHHSRTPIAAQVIRDNGLETFEMTENEIYAVRCLTSVVATSLTELARAGLCHHREAGATRRRGRLGRRRESCLT